MLAAMKCHVIYLHSIHKVEDVSLTCDNNRTQIQAYHHTVLAHSHSVFGPDDQWILFWFLAEARHFSFLQIVQMIYWAHLACSQEVPGTTGQGIEQHVCEHSHPMGWLLSSTYIKFFPREEPNLSHNEFPAEASFLIS